MSTRRDVERSQTMEAEIKILISKPVWFQYLNVSLPTDAGVSITLWLFTVEMVP